MLRFKAKITPNKTATKTAKKKCFLVFSTKSEKIAIQQGHIINPLGTGHKVFTGGCGGYSRGVRKKIRTSKGGTKILVGDYLNLGGYGKKLTFIIMLNIKCIYIQI